jgi:hypothetical protein
MKKYLLILLSICFILVSSSSAMMMIQGDKPPSDGGDCGSQSTFYEQASGGTSKLLACSGTIYSRGGSHQNTTGNAVDIYSITISVLTEEMEAEESGTATLRYEVDNDDLSAGYDAEVEVVISDGETGSIEFVFDTPVELPNNSTGYWMVQWSLDSADQITIDTATADNGYYNTACDWSMTASSVEPKHTVKKCD